MSFSLFFVVAGCAALGGYLAGRAAKKQHAEAAARHDAGDDDDTWKAGDVLSFAGEDDVVLAAEERWVRGGAEVARMFTSELGTVVLCLPPPDAAVLTLTPADLAVTDPPPGKLEIDGRVLSRRALVTLDGDADGDAAPMKLADYTDGIHAALVITGDGPPRVFAGKRHRAQDVDRLPGQKKRSSGE